jgi:hypothetical protein
VFISRSSLWTDLDCEDGDQARVYLERSRSLPVNLSLDTEVRLSPHHPFSEIIPHAIGRLRSLSIDGTPENLQDITAHLSHPAPLLEKLSICSGYDHRPHLNPMLRPALFNGDLSSLRELCLESVRTQLPWRNMVNLTSFTLGRTSPGGATVRQILDFFKSAPLLREVDFYSSTPTSGAQDCKLVSLACLKRMRITGGGSASLLLDHLLIPVGADLVIEVDLPSPPINDHSPRFLDNLKNLPSFTTIELWGEESHSYLQFSGPNGEVTMIAGGGPRFVLESLDHFDTSKTEQLQIGYSKSLSGDPPHRMLLPMKHLRTLKLFQFESSHIFIHALHPSMSSLGTVVCPQLEELHIELKEETLDLKDVIEMAAARASKGAKLKSVKIVQGSYTQTDVLELKKYVLHVELVRWDRW